MFAVTCGSDTIAPMVFDETVLYEQFVAARLEAMQLTDRYRNRPGDDAERVRIWDDVMRQTELAQGLLEWWLRTEDGTNTPAVVNTLDAGR
jgi:hypothetical protein